MLTLTALLFGRWLRRYGSRRGFDIITDFGDSVISASPRFP